MQNLLKDFAVTQDLLKDFYKFADVYNPSNYYQDKIKDKKSKCKTLTRRSDENRLFINNQKLAKIGHTREKIEHGYSYQNEPGIEKYKPKALTNYQKLEKMKHTSTTYEHEYYYYGEIDLIKNKNKNIFKARKNKPRAYLKKANCIALKIKIELFTNLIENKNESPEGNEDNNKRERVCRESFDNVCKMWLLKVENIRHVELEKRMPQNDIMDEISNTNKRILAKSGKVGVPPPKDWHCCSYPNREEGMQGGKQERRVTRW
ncbi:hypothetical protein C2G38_2164217 [Gigaspora rosea]|uniref:Uncharacterized protein n=1 Tax=Gigaspora rosea TaxID=44941 RepID=A0A397VXQ6_9GLOM|nr:hypothetical protein C2G38_2164217 [Gigaspora rosea]